MPLIFLILLLLHGYVAVRIVPALDAWPFVQVALCLLLATSAAAIPTTLLLLGRRGRPSTSGQRVKEVGFLMVGVASSLLVLTLLRDLGAGLLQIAALAVPDAWGRESWPPAWPGAARLNELSALAVPVLAVSATVAGWVGARRTAAVRNVDIPITDLPAALEGFTIVQISDIHVGNSIGREYVESVVDRVNGLQADVIAITGDLVDGTVSALGAASRRWRFSVRASARSS